jgi:hypothetical protein
MRMSGPQRYWGELGRFNWLGGQCRGVTESCWGSSKWGAPVVVCTSESNNEEMQWAISTCLEYFAATISNYAILK